jgi:5-methylcytosine-specific restriction endonuclease McrA
LKKLKEIDKNLYNSAEQDYLETIITLYETKNILIKNPSEIEDLKKQIKRIPPNSKSPKKGLKSEILDSLDYKGLRSSFYPEYFYRIQIKACVYCNSVLTISTQKKKPRSLEHKGNFDVDHYHSKDDYPFLSIFLFNLYPACAPCNRKKSKSNKIKFDLYSEDPIKVSSSQFNFELDKGSMAKFLLTKNKEDLHFKFNSGASGFQEKFGIQEIYETQKDLIEELIIKKHMYDKDNRISLYKSFSKLSLHPDLYLRTFVGNYINETDIHKRPLSKITQDIARNLGIIE